MFNKILVPLDGSENSNRALDTAINISKKFNGQITLIHVYSVKGTFAMYNEFQVMPSMEISNLTILVHEAGTHVLSIGEKKVKAEVSRYSTEKVFERYGLSARAALSQNTEVIADGPEQEKLIHGEMDLKLESPSAGEKSKN